MTDLTRALEDVLRAHRDPFGTDKPAEDFDAMCEQSAAEERAWHDNSPHQRRARERADKEAAR